MVHLQTVLYIEHIIQSQQGTLRKQDIPKIFKREDFNEEFSTAVDYLEGHECITIEANNIKWIKSEAI